MQLLIHKRVCLEPSPVVRTRMLYKRWKALDLVKLMWRSSEPNWPMSNAKKEQRPSADGRQRLFANHLMCKERKLSLRWTIRKKQEHDSCRCVLKSWIEWTSDWSLVMLERRCWKQVLTFVPVTKCNGWSDYWLHNIRGKAVRCFIPPKAGTSTQAFVWNKRNCYRLDELRNHSACRDNIR
jgi:hypothetical protein